SLALPGETVQSLAIDTHLVSPSYGDIYLAYFLEAGLGSKPHVVKLSPAGSALDLLEEPENPRAIAVDPSNGEVRAASKEARPLFFSSVEFFRFDPAGVLLDEPFESVGLRESTGLAISAPPTCGLPGSDLVVTSSESGNGFIRLFGPPP